MELTIDVAVLLAVVIFFRARRKPLARTRSDAWLTVFLALAFGVLIAPTTFGQGVFHVVGQLAQGISQSTNP
ncbi:hypothetical protein GCM10022403_027340 [Streptomyces coacervatus]|uniref:Uncharacterized protein n=1 Tax=Streptomyces coacervatus TaxID=647381 RepID=A0ABP7HLG5_9ACTN|nr:hypothetical protein [Streptomyces coacervatus]MDF2265527.1 hypothetical protein [Streptomyces coacervatus]